MAAKPVHTGNEKKIEQWFRDNPDKQITSLELAEQFGIERWQVNNAITGLKRKNVIVPGDVFSIGRAHYTPHRLRKENEARNEFKVARVRPKASAQSVLAKIGAQMDEEMSFPVLEEITPERLTNAAKRLVNGAFSTAAQNGRVQYVNTNTFIVWNSREQLDDIRRMAISH